MRDDGRRKTKDESRKAIGSQQPIEAGQQRLRKSKKVTQSVRNKYSAPPSSVFRPSSSVSQCEAEVFPGLEELARDEIQSHFGNQVHIGPQAAAGRIDFQYLGNLRSLLDLRRVVSVWLIGHFAIPRPKALLGHQHFETLTKLIQAVLALHPAGTFTTFRISAAGEHSTIFARLKEEIARRTGLQSTEEPGDLLLAIRPAPEFAGWEVAIRLSPRPLAARAWRVCNLPGALNAAVASCMIGLAGYSPADRVLNLACGSGTLLIERLLVAPASQAIGCDMDSEALICARRNLHASAVQAHVELGQWDARALPLADRSITTLYADLPFGALVGSHRANAEIYPQIMQEAARVARPGARFALITQEVRLIDQLLAEQSAQWTIKRILRITLPTNTALIKPCIYLLERTVDGRR